MNLIDRYVAEIGKHLARRTRTDIQNEIRSTLDDMLEDRSQKTGRPADDDMIVDLLKEFGRPEKVAASYQPERTLIGPQLYPIYLLILQIVLPIVTLVLLITSGIGLATAQQTFAEGLNSAVQALMGILGAVVSAVGSITITFAILDRVPGFGARAAAERLGEEKDWEPRHLPEVRDVAKFSIPGLLAETIFTLAALVIFNFYPQIIGFGFVLNGTWTYLPILSEAFFRYLPYLTGLWILQIVLDLILVRQGRWQTATRWVSIGLKALGVALAAVMLAGPDLVGSLAEALAQAAPNMSSDAVSILTWMPRLAVKLALGLSVVLGGMEVFKSIYQEITGKTRS